jgi:NAD-dependent deacetylase
MQRELVVVFSGAGMSAESGLPTFRDSGGLWCNYTIEEVATPQAWQRNPELVLAFYNERRAKMLAAEPNAAHRALVQLESHYEVCVITQNVDDLHERAGSSQVLHLHGQLRYARSTADASLTYERTKPIALGDTCELGSQLRPHIVWFGEAVENMVEAVSIIKRAYRVLVVGTSLTVYPAAGILQYARRASHRVIVAPELESPPQDYHWLRGPATEHVPRLVTQWIPSPEGPLNGV